MARSFTLAEMTTMIRQRCDLEGSTHVTDGEIQTLISSAVAQLHSILVNSGLRYYESEDPVTTVAGTATYALPAAYFGTVGVDYVEASGTRRALVEFMAQDRNYFTSTGQGLPQAYAVVGANLVLYPTPNAVYSVKHVYIPQPTKYTSATSSATSVDVVTPDGEEFVVSTAAVWALLKEESDVSVHKQNALEARQRIENDAQVKAITSHRRIIIEEGSMERDPADWRINR